MFKSVLPAAFTIALLGSIEALLCAVVADGMTNTKHNSNKELVSQGIANTVLPFFGVIPATAAIARTAVNIREGAKTKWAGVYHALFLFLIVVLFASLGTYLPMSFLAGVLMFVSFKMINFKEFKTIANISKADTLVLYLTFFLTIFTNLVFAVQVGMFAAIFLIFMRLTQMIEIAPHVNLEEYDAEDKLEKAIPSVLKEKIAVYTINGPFFFGAMNVFDNKVSEQLPLEKEFIILRMKHVSFVDSTGVERLKTFIHKRKKQGKEVFLTSVNKEVEKKLFADREFREMVKKEELFAKTSSALHHIEALDHLKTLG